MSEIITAGVLIYAIFMAGFCVILWLLNRD